MRPAELNFDTEYSTTVAYKCGGRNCLKKLHYTKFLSTSLFQSCTWTLTKPTVAIISHLTRKILYIWIIKLCTQCFKLSANNQPFPSLTITHSLKAAEHSDVSQLCALKQWKGHSGRNSDFKKAFLMANDDHTLNFNGSEYFEDQLCQNQK